MVRRRGNICWAYYGSGTEGAWEADTKDVFRNTAEYASTLAMTAYNLDLQENEICENFRPD